MNTPPEPYPPVYAGSICPFRGPYEITCVPESISLATFKSTTTQYSVGSFFGGGGVTGSGIQSPSAAPQVNTIANSEGFDVNTPFWTIGPFGLQEGFALNFLFVPDVTSAKYCVNCWILPSVTLPSFSWI